MKGCPSKKRRFRNEGGAVMAAWRSECFGQPLTIYRCPMCGSIHLTSQNPGRNGGVLSRAERLSQK